MKTLAFKWLQERSEFYLRGKSLRRTAKYASLLRISGALHLALFEQPGKDDFFKAMLDSR